DTKCQIVPRLDQRLNIGQASASNISDAARAVIRECVIKRRLGGEAVNIGRRQQQLCH
ncbi:MAG: hypothetical protein Q9221_007398, partial [Calogaya cf. arnoldii]